MISRDILRNCVSSQEPVITQWFLCMYLNVLPMHSVLRIWDTIFCEGSAVLMRVAIGLLKQHEEELLQCADFGDAFMTLQEMTKGDVDCENLIGVAFNEKLLGAFSREGIKAMRGQHAGEVQSEDAVEAAYQAEVKAKMMQVKEAKEGAKAGKDLAEQAAKAQDQAQPLKLEAADVPEQLS